MTLLFWTGETFLCQRCVINTRAAVNTHTATIPRTAACSACGAGGSLAALPYLPDEAFTDVLYIRPLFWYILATETVCEDCLHTYTGRQAPPLRTYPIEYHCVVCQRDLDARYMRSFAAFLPRRMYYTLEGPGTRLCEMCHFQRPGLAAAEDTYDHYVKCSLCGFTNYGRPAMNYDPTALRRYWQSSEDSQRCLDCFIRVDAVADQHRVPTGRYPFHACMDCGSVLSMPHEVLLPPGKKVAAGRYELANSHNRLTIAFTNIHNPVEYLHG